MMNLERVFKYASEQTPDIKVIENNGWYRHDVANLLRGTENIGIELGVAKGIYAKRMVESNKFKRFYGVDLYGDTHNIEEYRTALKFIGFQNLCYCLLRMDFDSALELFEDNYFDFIYVDGFAHTGEEGGKTLVNWIKKLKIGGILAGDDYHDDWPLVKWAVNDLAKKLDADLNVTTEIEDNDFSRYPTWFIIKKNENELEINENLYQIAMKEKKRIYKKYYAKASILRLVQRKIERFIGMILSLLGLKNKVLKLLRRFGYL